MINPLIMYLQRRDHLSIEEIAVLENLTQRRDFVLKGNEIVKQGSHPTESFVLIQGATFREHHLRKGARMISAMHIAGDFVDLHSTLLGKMDHAVVAASNCIISRVAHADLREIADEHPHLRRLLWTTIATDAATHRTAITVIGRLTPPARIAHLVCELYLRLETVGLAGNWTFTIPVYQTDLADMFGMSTIHLNRSLQALRNTGALSWQGSQVVIHDWDQLAHLAEFDATYLNLNFSPAQHSSTPKISQLIAD
ncbi:MAG TPA: Crp/Fnr family transcriptional regulator [Tianweitania sediminis]|nr:Crp/Fnr family transcriptional regulator [Tianweitania sediminis]